MTYADTKWAERLNYLAEIEDGWYDGEGESINPEVLDQANDILKSLDSPNFNVPAMFPLLGEDEVEGGIIMEWAERHRPHHLNLQISNNFAYEVYVFNLETRESMGLETDSCEEAVQILTEHLIRVGFATLNRDNTSEALPK
jgi:hypothetical protein